MILSCHPNHHHHHHRLAVMCVMCVCFFELSPMCVPATPPFFRRLGPISLARESSVYLRIPRPQTWK